MRRMRTPDWKQIGWHYKLLHRVPAPIHNRLLVRMKGAEHLHREGGFVYASNHSSWWDAIVLNTCSPRPVHWLVKKEMGNNAFSRWFFLTRGGCIAVDRDTRNPEAFAAAEHALRDGRIIGIFPETTRHVGKLGPAKTGAARLAIATGVPVVPVALLTDEFWPPGRSVPDLRKPIWIHVGAPMTVEGDPRAATDAIMARIGDLLDDARRARATGAKWPRAT